VGEQLFWNVGFTGTLGRSGPRFQLLVQNILDQKPQIPAVSRLLISNRTERFFRPAACRDSGVLRRPT
jgi:hypothetical protein